MRPSRSELVGEWPGPSPAYLSAFLLFLRFEVACEEFDRTLPGFFFRDDSWIPMGAGRSESIRFARERREELRKAAFLILAAPELLESLHSVLDHFVPRSKEAMDELVRAVALIERIEAKRGEGGT